MLLVFAFVHPKKSDRAIRGQGKVEGGQGGSVKTMASLLISITCQFSTDRALVNVLKMLRSSHKNTLKFTD